MLDFVVAATARETVLVDAFDLARAAAWNREPDETSTTASEGSWVAQQGRLIRECLPALGGDLDQLMAQLRS